MARMLVGGEVNNTSGMIILVIRKNDVCEL